MKLFEEHGVYLTAALLSETRFRHLHLDRYFALSNEISLLRAPPLQERFFLEREVTFHFDVCAGGKEIDRFNNPSSCSLVAPTTTPNPFQGRHRVAEFSKSKPHI